MRKIAVYYNLRFGGAKRVVFEQVKGLRKKGYTVDVYTLNHDKDIFSPEKHASSKYSYTYNQPEIKLPFVGKILVDLSTFFSLKNLHKKIAEDIDSKRYDIVLVHPDRLTQAPYLLRFIQTPSAYYCQEPLRIVYEYALRFKKNVGVLNRLYESATRSIRKKIDLENVRHATFTIASCNHIRERMIEAYDVYPMVSYPGIDTRIFTPGKVKKKNEIIFIGNKDVVTDGYDLAEKSLKYIPSSKRPKLRVISWKENNNKRLTEKELVNIYRSAIATFCLSRMETFGLVPLESMACGTPVIATNISGHRETIVDKETGLLVDFLPKQISQKVLSLIDNPLYIKKMGDRASSHVKNNWNWKKRIDDLENVLKEFIASTKE